MDARQSPSTRKLSVWIALLLSSLYAGAALAIPKNGIEIHYLNNIVYSWQSQRGDNLAISRFLSPVYSDLTRLKIDLADQLRSELQAELPGWIDVDYTNIDFQNQFTMRFISLGGGRLQLSVTMPQSSAHARLSAGSSILADAHIDVTMTQFQLAGTYDLYTGQVVLSAPQPPAVHVDIDYGGIVGELANLVSLGLLNRIVDDMAEDLQQQANAAVLSLLQTKIAEYSTTVFGVEQILPPNLFYNGIDVGNEIRNALNNLPAGNILSVYYNSTVFYGNLWIDIGANASIYLYYRNQPPGPPGPRT